MKTHRAAVLDDGVPEAGVALRSQLLAIGPSEDQGLRQAAVLLVFVSHAVPAVVRDALVRLCGQELQQLQLNRCGVRLLLLTSIAELKPDVDLTALNPTSRHLSLYKTQLLISYPGSTVHVSSKPDQFAGAGTGLCPPVFLGNVGWIGRDAGFTIFHITEDPDGVLCASLIWINPVLTCIRGTLKRSVVLV